MAGKPTVYGTEALSFVVGQTSKNALIDLILCRAMHAAGQDATEKQVCEKIDSWFAEVDRARGQKRIPLVRLLGRYRLKMDQVVKR